MKLGKKITWLLVFIFIGMQFYRPEKNLSTEDHMEVFITETNPPEEVVELLQSSCYDCHSDNTNYPWYNQVAPVSWWLADHIEEGSEHLNFSQWDSYGPKKKDHKLEEVIEMVETAEMPLNAYTWIHAEAQLTDNQRQAIIDWARQTRTLYQLGDLPK